MMNKIMKALTPKVLLALIVALPLIVASLYFWIFAQDRYVSTSILTVRRAHQESISSSALGLLLPGGGGASVEDTRMLRDYMVSDGLLRHLDERFKLRKHYESATSDPIYRLWPGTSQERWLEYWRSRVEISLDDFSGLLTVRVQAFDSATATQITTALLDESDKFVNGITHRIAQEQMEFSQDELTRAGDNLVQARGLLTAFQDRHRMIDPAVQTQATGTLAIEMHGQLARFEAELTAKQAYLNPDAADVVALKAQIDAVRLQIARETRGMTASGGDALNKLTLEFRDIKARAALAEERYKSALASTEATRIESSRRAKSLVVVEPPTRPETAEYPRRLYDTFTLLVVALLGYMIVRLVVTTINEHRH